MSITKQLKNKIRKTKMRQSKIFENSPESLPKKRECIKLNKRQTLKQKFYQEKKFEKFFDYGGESCENIYKRELKKVEDLKADLLAEKKSEAPNANRISEIKRKIKNQSTKIKRNF